MTKLTCSKTQELNEKCSFLNGESVMHIKCFLQIHYFAICQSKVLCFDLNTNKQVLVQLYSITMSLIENLRS